ncbi:sporulation protein [Polynucleobacter paneuropaeus]|nr:sporulation protein [Polynucleobacter paneuropaeus]MBT8531359.1 sporulation protein [Polynucleobacter paneuropaeus]MBT8602084.1 sporulation protein [Polynucleobacter paneuropaeus]MBT8624036.1 sporulation protein [Polynucleobacter paneuropaeus]MBT8629079.1 sporulation protein [Polynucleobacter paneuropaeus]
MIRLPKLFKRNSQSDDLQRGSAGTRRTPKKITSRAFIRSQENEEPALTEDPDIQRARHRLIGAGVLVILAFITLPRILDSKPKPVNNDIAVNIVTSLPVPGMNSETVTAQSTPSSVAPITPVPSPAPSNKVEAKSDTNKLDANTNTSQNQTPPAVSATDTKPSASPVPAKSAALGLAAGEEVIAATNKTKPKTDTPATKPASNTPGKFVIQIGAFASEDRANGWITKMKDQKIPNYVNNKTSPDGTKLFVLRAGPFPDRESAEAAEKKIKAMGLNSRIVETGKS